MISRFFYLALLFLSLYIKILSIDEPDLVIQTTNLVAELTSIKYKGIEYLHDGKTFWSQHSPILFPIVGKLRYDATLINGKEYAIPKHGFAMNMEFVKIGEHSYKLFSNEETLKQFPFD
jgi:galactose mutarotase-like enzyme